MEIGLATERESGKRIMSETLDIIEPEKDLKLEKKIRKKEEKKRKKKERRRFRLRILGSIAVILNFSAISGACGLIPIPFLGILPLFVSMFTMEIIINAIFGKLKKGASFKTGFFGGIFNRTVKKSLNKVLDRYMTLLLAVNVPGNAIKVIPYIGTIAGIVVSIVCMALSTIVYGLLVFIPLAISEKDYY